MHFYNNHLFFVFLHKSMIAALATVFATSLRPIRVRSMIRMTSSSQNRQLRAADATQEDWEIVVDVLSRFSAPDRVERLNGVLAKRRAGVHVVVENMEDPFDVAAIMRTAEGLGIHHVHTIDSVRLLERDHATGAESSTHRRKARRVNRRSLSNVAMGASRWLTVHKHQKTEDCYRALKEIAPEMQILAAAYASPFDAGLGVSRFDNTSSLVQPIRRCDAPQAGSRALDQIDLLGAAAGTADGGKGGIALVFGDAHLSRSAYEHADATFHLPDVKGVTRSFGPSIRMAMSLHTVVASGAAPEGKLSEAERTEQLGRWLMRDVRAAKQLLHKEASLELLLDD